ncbi:MAG TPA: UDP-N-acetylmuramoyl-L-alanine--D-glutamate ligase [Peptococcaceae bacterium]|nr:UDP-N-acetylmuramoyl-L-alanine--D-glutamate ligase [Peptococcaceae bacterium]
MDFQGKKVLVVGAGLSGQAAVGKLLRSGAEVFLTDKEPKDKLQNIEKLALDDSHLRLGKEPEIELIKPDLLVLSPGVSPQLPFIQEAMSKGIPVWSEVELALRDLPALKIGVTGSNGKTTTTTLIGELAKATGRPTIVAGNIGIALSGLVDELKEDGIVVAELSSFQLELIDRMQVNIAVVLNLTPDHLDRHGTMEAYVQAKARILENQTFEDLAVLNWDDPLIRDFKLKTKARVRYFSVREQLTDGICLRGKDIVVRHASQATKIIGYQELLLRGSHNLENVMAAVAAGLEMGLTVEDIAKVLREFRPVKHRQEIVGKFNDILFINDSKATNPDSAIKALQSYEEPIVLIAGGKNKGLDMTEFLLEAKKRVKSLVLVGEAAAELERVARSLNMQRVLRAGSFEDAVAKAIGEAEPGDVVLLSPACTSWDMFKSYEIRGELFKELVRNHYSEP